MHFNVSQHRNKTLPFSANINQTLILDVRCDYTEALKIMKEIMNTFQLIAFFSQNLSKLLFITYQIWKKKITQKFISIEIFIRKLMLLNSFKHDVTKIDNQNIFTVRKVLHILLNFFCKIIIHHVMKYENLQCQNFYDFDQLK